MVPRSRLAPTQPQHLSSFGAEEGPNSVAAAAAAEKERKGNKHGLNMQKETFFHLCFYVIALNTKCQRAILRTIVFSHKENI